MIPQGAPEGDHMANGRVQMAVREVDRQCRTLRISAEQNTSVRIADDSPLLSWLPRFAAQVMNKMRMGKDGKTREMRRTGRRWRKPMAQFGENVWFRKIGEDGVSSFASHLTQGIFLGHHDRTGAVSCIIKNGVVRGTSWTRQTLSDAWESTNWEGLFGTPWQMVAPELKLTKKVKADKGAGPPLTRIVVERAPEAEPRRFYVLSADIEAHGHTGGCPGCAALASHGKATKPHNSKCRERIRTIIERTLTGKVRMNAYKDRIAETERVKERKRTRVERGAGDVLVEAGNRADEQVFVRHADTSGGDIRENQHEEERMRDIHVGKRGPEAAGGEQPDMLRKTVRFDKEAPSASSSSDPLVALEYPASGETQDRLGSVPVQKSGSC